MTELTRLTATAGCWPSGETGSGPVTSCLMPAVPSAETLSSALTISGSNWPQSSSNSQKQKPSGMESDTQGFATSSIPPITRPPNSSLK